MAQRCLVLYASRTGNTEMVAQAFKKVFDRNGWQCDMVKVKKGKKSDELNYNCTDYDFLCFGSPVHNGLPVEEVITAMRKAKEESGIPHEKLVPGPKKGIVFATYAGEHLGPREAEAVLVYMAIEMEHLKFQCIGSFCCPGPMKIPGKGGKPPQVMGPPPDAPRWWHGDISDRPNEKDLLKAEIFMEDKLEEIAIRHPDQ